ncbi:MATE family efflux transporter [Paenisporosarcina quisquiliarum]|uniref:Probable multidrug resistance protein NorM n=1 Tax=Paenisporosarcina quisquiliarum TaxID=365346 RepID=A0A9X3LDH3_9BACL|nr:MATE family efflux transporter [Paenisporosarcina quisquiliarum]MCZ8535873.1 MATE family efflux transporter [Paenisporosarcina quisquiliarum]
MHETSHFKEKWSLMLKIIFPILVTQVALYLVSFFDILMSSRYGSEDLAGVAVGSSLWVPVYTGLAGILLAVTPIVAQLVGAKKKEEVKLVVQQGLFLSLALSTIVIVILLFLLEPLLQSMTLEPRVETIAKSYLYAMIIGIIPLFAYNVLRSYMDALGKTRVTMIITLLSAPINVFFNYLLIFGKFGFPELGGAGAGYASAITYWLIFLIALGVAHYQSPFKQYELFNNWERVQFSKWRDISKIGVPIGLSIFAETSIFSAVTLMMSTYSTAVISAHQIALNFTSLLYMVPLSISIGATVLVGFEVGAKRFHDAKIYSWLSVSTAIIFSFFSACILFFFREQIAGLYTTDVTVIQLTIQFFIFAALFQLSDAIQAPVQGSLRGYKDVNVTFIMAIISYWVIGLPIGYLLSKFTDFGPFGYWIGLIIGLTAGAITLSLRLIKIQRKKHGAVL